MKLQDKSAKLISLKKTGDVVLIGRTIGTPKHKFQILVHCAAKHHLGAHRIQTEYLNKNVLLVAMA